MSKNEILKNCIQKIKIKKFILNKNKLIFTYCFVSY